MCLQGYSPHCCLQSSLQTIKRVTGEMSQSGPPPSGRQWDPETPFSPPCLSFSLNENLLPTMSKDWDIVSVTWSESREAEGKSGKCTPHGQNWDVRGERPFPTFSCNFMKMWSWKLQQQLSWPWDKSKAKQTEAEAKTSNDTSQLGVAWDNKCP